MSFLDLAWKRKSIRNYTAADVPIELLMKLLDAARTAPSGGNRQPWHFYVIKDAALKAKVYEAAGSRQDFMLDAPVQIIVCADLERSAARYGDRGRNLYCLQDTAAAIQNLLLCATDEGLAACWCGAFDESAVASALQLPEALRPIAIIPLGYAVNEPPKTPRRPIEDISTFIGFDDVATPDTEPQRPKIEHSDMSGALFNDLNLDGAEFVNINMHGCSLHDINLSNSTLFDANLTNMTIDHCNIDGLTINGVKVSALLE